MPAPKGNRFWEARATLGKGKVFSTPDKLWESCVQYFEWNHDNPLQKVIVYQGEITGYEPLTRAMTIDALCTFLGCDSRTWRNYRSKEGYEEYFPVVEEVERVIRAQKFEGASAGLLNPNIIARDLGLKDGIEADHRSSDGSMSPKRANDLTDDQLAEVINGKSS